MKESNVEGYRQSMQDIVHAIATAKLGTPYADAKTSLIAVTKSISLAEVIDLHAAGCTEFAENRWQQAREKVTDMRLQDNTWHFIGHCQTNKVKYVIPWFSWIHSIDNLDLATALSVMSVRQGTTLRGLIQVNIAAEENKQGIATDALRELLEHVRNLPGISIRGLMTMAPATENSEQVRPIFQTLRQLRDDMQSFFADELLTELSMGMSSDFEVAVQEGATMVRIGRRLVHPLAN